ncbi:glutamate 5-kinase, partial [Rhodococcus hoagii]|nr:glutamate 5-kinase [Prescottella equi]MBM4503065.1 glutamate 5-kinase [Prescottella equi]
DRPSRAGVVAYDSTEIEDMLGHSTTDLPADMHRPVVHADDLVAL